jgi:membrane protein DedA with SNARE-associated domain
MKLGPLIVAALLAAALAARWRRWPVRLRALAATAVFALGVWGSGAVHVPNLETVARDIGAVLGSYTYAVVGVMALLETGAGIGLVAPGELAVVIGGVTAGQGHTSLPVLISIVWACALTGDLASYVLGRRLGRGFLLRHGHLVNLGPARLGQVEAFLGRHGGKTIIVGRFIGVVRALAPFVAGSSRMPARRFIPATLLASGLWSAAFTMLGYVFWQSFDRAAEIAKEGTLVLILAVLLLTGAIVAHRMLRSSEGRAQLRIWVSAPVRKWRRIRLDRARRTWPGAGPPRRRRGHDAASRSST